MTISYQRDVASSTAGGFTRLLFKWKGSLYKLIYRELLLFQAAYILLSLLYRQILTQNQKGLFEMVVKYFDAFLNLIPLSFVLGFYVSYVASRWWQQFLAIPWPDKLFHTVACFVDGFDQDSRILRRSLMRYMNLALILVLRSISSAVKQRFPTLDHVVEAGFMTNQEKELFSAVPCTEFNTYWIPCTWFIFRLQEASKKGKLINEYALETIMREFAEFRSKCGLLWCYDWVSIPMVYTQVVTLATYVFFIFTVIGRQKIDTIKKGDFMRSGRMPMDIDLYIPIFTVLQFFFYMGLLKVAEQLINPFGDDDEDFELNWLVDRHMKASFLGCDILMDPDRIPPMVKDYYWDKQNCPIPYTEASMHFKRKTYKGSADDMIVPESKQCMVLPEIEEEENDNKKLSLTSLLLETSSHLVSGSTIGTHHHNNLEMISGDNYRPGAWRNTNTIYTINTPLVNKRSESYHEQLHHPEFSSVTDGRQSNGKKFMNASADSINYSVEEELEIQGNFDESRRGSRFSDPDKRKKPKKRKDKHGFVWRRMHQDDTDYLPNSRTPRLGILPSMKSTLSIPVEMLLSSSKQCDTSEDCTIYRPNATKMDSTLPSGTEEENTSQISFQTCSSDPNITSILSRAVADNYDSATLRKVTPHQKNFINNKYSLSLPQSSSTSHKNEQRKVILLPVEHKFNE